MDERKEDVTLEWKDWIALFIASLQTVLLPIVLIVLILFLIYFVLVFS